MQEVPGTRTATITTPTASEMLSSATTRSVCAAAMLLIALRVTGQSTFRHVTLDTPPPYTCDAVQQGDDLGAVPPPGEASARHLAQAELGAESCPMDGVSAIDGGKSDPGRKRAKKER